MNKIINVYPAFLKSELKNNKNPFKQKLILSLILILSDLLIYYVTTSIKSCFFFFVIFFTALIKIINSNIVQNLNLNGYFIFIIILFFWHFILYDGFHSLKEHINITRKILLYCQVFPLF